MDTTASFPCTNHDVDVEVFHGTVKNLFYRHGQTMNLVDKKHISWLQVIQNRYQITGFFDDRTRRLLKIDSQFIGNDKSHGCFPETWRAKQKNMVQRLITHFCCFDKDLKLIFDLVLTDIFT